MKSEEKNTSLLPPHLKRADFFLSLLKESEITITEIARRYKVSLSFVSNTLRLIKLPEAVKEGLLNGDISEGHARALLMVSDSQKMIMLYKKIIVEKLSVRKIEKLVKEGKN